MGHLNAAKGVLQEAHSAEEEQGPTPVLLVCSTLSQPQVLRVQRCVLLTMTAAALSSTIWDLQFSSINALNLKTSSPNYTLGTKKAKPSLVPAT